MALLIPSYLLALTLGIAIGVATGMRSAIELSKPLRSLGSEGPIAGMVLERPGEEKRSRKWPRSVATS